jgi:GNAT superfamily N-acetyltransferase
MRQATRDDLLELLRMCRSFSEAAKHPIDRERIVSTHEALMDSEHGLVLIADGGMLTGIIADSLFNTGKFAQELFWWVDEDKRGSGVGKELLEAFEAWAGFNGADRVIMVALQELTPRKVGKLYRAAGYVPLEHSYTKEL